MRIKSEAALDEFRGPGRCEWCGIGCMRREPHHLKTRGAGGSDIRLNLIAVGGTGLFRCQCHNLLQGGTLEVQAKAWAKVADREGVSVLVQREVIDLIWRLDQRPRHADIEKAISEVSEDARGVVIKILTEAKKL